MTKARYVRTVSCRDAFGNTTLITVTVFEDGTLRVTTPLSGAEVTDTQVQQLIDALTAATGKRPHPEGTDQ